MPVVIGTKVYMKLYIITKYIMWAKCCAFVIYILIIICRNIDIPDGHFKHQVDGQVSCLYQFHMNPHIVKCMCTNFDPPVVVSIF